MDQGEGSLGWYKYELCKLDGWSHISWNNVRNQMWWYTSVISVLPCEVGGRERQLAWGAVQQQTVRWKA